MQTEAVCAGGQATTATQTLRYLLPARGAAGPEIQQLADGVADLPAASATVACGSAVAAQRLGQRDDRLRDRGLGRLLDQRHAVVAHLDHRAIVVGKLPEDLAADRLLGLLQADLVVQADAIDHDLDLVLDPVHLAERHHQPHDVAQAGQVELRDQQDVVGHFQGHHVDRRCSPSTGR